MKKKVFILIAIILILIFGSLTFYNINKNSTEESVELSNEESENTDISSTNNIVSSENIDLNKPEYIALYNGFEISTNIGIQGVTEGMDINSENEEKYNITYYNFEEGKYDGESIGTFSKETETYDGIAYVGDVSKFAFSEYYDAVPYEYTTVEELPEELSYLADYTSVNIEKIDLDGNGNYEYIVCYTIEKSEEETEDGEPVASSYIMLLNTDYEKVANLVSLENGYWANIKDPDQKILLSLENDVEYIDIDNDGIMEIVINVPIYEGNKISIVKYVDGNIYGETDVEANLLP